MYLELILYCRYVDDAGSLAKTKTEALSLTDRIAEQDTSGRLKWEVDYPKDKDSYVPFLATEIQIDNDGKINSRFYRKPQKKKITLHWKSHHPLTTKQEVAKNFYRTAREVSSGVGNEEKSVAIVDDLLQCNGYEDPRRFDSTKQKEKRKKKRNTEDTVSLVLPYVSEELCNKIKEQIRRQKLPIKTIFKPGVKLRDMFTSSRPFDRVDCTVGSGCKICPHMEKPGCAQANCVYMVTCELCRAEYGGETGRSMHDRMMEHQRAAANPPSYPENAIGKHYLENHIDDKPKLSYQILDRQPNPVKRKIAEAAMIFGKSPVMNDRTELPSLRKFLV